MTFAVSATDSPLAALADVTIAACPAGNAISEHANQVRSSQLAIVDAIVSEIRSTVDSNGSGRYSRVSEILSMHSVRD